jgi:hypothetical protein
LQFGDFAARVWEKGEMKLRKTINGRSNGSDAIAYSGQQFDNG